MRMFTRILICLALATAILMMAACATAPASTQTAQPPPTPAPATPAPDSVRPSPIVMPAATPPASPEPTASPEKTSATPPQSDQPFSYIDDIMPLIEDFYTIGDIIELVGAQTVEWQYEGEASDISHLIFRNGDNFVALLLDVYTLEDSILRGFSDKAHPLSVLPPEVVETQAVITGAMWNDNDFVIPFVRGVGIGAAEEDVLRAFLCLDPTGEAIYGIDAVYPLADESWASEFVGARRAEYETLEGSTMDVIEYVWSYIEEEGGWLEYHSLVYEIEDAKVKSIQLFYSTDPE